jgi:L-rhamnose mutarotase
MKVALPPRARPDAIDAHERTHHDARTELTNAIRSAGASAWTIWCGGVDLGRVIESDNYGRLPATLATMPANVAWEADMADLLETAPDCSAAGADHGLPVVWRL